MNKFKDWIIKEWKETVVLMKCIPAWVLTLFVISVVGMNLLANKSIDTGSLTWLALDTGIFVSWLSFLTMDIIVKRFGPKASTKISIIAILINIVVSVLFMLAAKVPGFWGESFVEVGGEAINQALNNTFSGTWYILLASTFAFLVSAVVNNLLNWCIGKLYRNNPNSFIAYASRSYISTAVAQFVDNLIFALIISLNFFGWSFLQCITCALTGAIVELVFEIIFSPIGFKITNKWDKEKVGQEYIDLINNQNK